MLFRSIVGFGDEQEALAALCGLFADVERRAASLLSIEGLSGVSLQTIAGDTITACLRELEDDVVLTLATYASGPGITTSELGHALDRFRHALAAGTHRAPHQETTT